MENDPHRKDIERPVREKQEMAQKLAAKLRRRAGLLRKFAEKYRNSSAERLYGWKKDKEE